MCSPGEIFDEKIRGEQKFGELKMDIARAAEGFVSEETDINA